MSIRVTQTQQFIVREALEASGADPRLADPELIDDIIRAILVIEEGQMQAYMLRGFKWSCRSRNRREPFNVARDQQELQQSVEHFHQRIEQMPGEATRRIRGNRARRLKKMVREAEFLQEFVGQQLLNLKQRRRGIFHGDAENWFGEVRQLHGAEPQVDAA